MTRRLKPIPRFPNEEAEREFWASHDFADYFDLAQARPARFPDLEPSKTTISLRLPEGLLADLKVLANRMDVPYQSLMKVYLAERVREELGRGRTAEELASTVREPEPPYGVAPPGTHRARRTPRKTGTGARRRAAPRARR